MRKQRKKKNKPASFQTERTLRPAASGGAPTGVSVYDEPVVPETEEPTASRFAVPVLIIALLGALVYFADMYLMDHSGGFSAQVYYPLTEVRSASNGPDGKGIFNNNCAACHQPSGAGSTALGFPPLAGSDWVLAPGPNRLARIVLHGLTGPMEVNGQPYNNTMLPWKDTMTDEQIAAVLTYIRSAWGNKASAVTKEQVAAIRQATADRTRNWTADELKAIPESD